MKQRCLNPNNASFAHYGGRGITVCDQWREDFTAFLADMGQPPPGMWLDRRDNHGPYSKENCRWATPREQNQNRRGNRFVEWRGERLCIHEWGRRTGLGQNISHRLRCGWSVERALTTPA